MSVRHTTLNVHVQNLSVANDLGTFAGAALCLDNLALTLARVACRLNLLVHARCNLVALQCHTAALACRALLDVVGTARARAETNWTRDTAVHLHLDHLAQVQIFEVHGQLHSHVRPTLLPPLATVLMPTTAAETKLPEQVERVVKLAAAATESTICLLLQPFFPVSVVRGALVLVAQHLVRLAHLVELRADFFALAGRVLVRVVLDAQAFVRALDFALGGLLADLENVVVAGSGCHGHSCCQRQQ